MQGVFKIAAATPRLRLGDAEANALECARMAEAASRDGGAAVVFPELCLTGYTCGDLFFRGDLLASASAALECFAEKTSNLPIVSIVGLPVAEGAAIYNAAAVVYGGAVAGIVRKRALPNYGEYYERRQFTPAPQDEPISVFDAGPFRFCVEICEDLWTPTPPSSIAASQGVDVAFNLSASTDYLGKSHRRNELVCGQSARLGCAYAMASSGTGESSCDAVFGGSPVISVDGRMVAAGELFRDAPQIVVAAVDVEALRYRRRSMSSIGNAFAASSIRVQEIRLRANLPEATPDAVPDSPFLIEYAEPAWHEKLLGIQGAALARRMTSAHVKRLVIGVSGGADSALALLGAAAAVDRMDLPRTDIIAVVMPGLGSTSRTQERAAALAEAMGTTVRVVDISDSCRMHLAGIGHDKDKRDIAYENAQARERMQVLMDIANMENALVVGTGDLSEIALGWNTYGGDHISMYQLNASVPKTMVLAALRLVAEASSEPLRSLLAEIADAPITPELVPGAAANDTESRLGPYELHDFFLFHYLSNGASPDKIEELAKIAFAGKYPVDTIGETLKTFLRRFRNSQYKRNCVPDGPKITLSLSPRADWRMPSDLP
ncbi:MAG: NAD(+) synthase [Kiritimatiellae bacterium]|nr:NAD(+) synthase [Kiritimatiellia bacterium]